MNGNRKFRIAMLAGAAQVALLGSAAVPGSRRRPEGPGVTVVPVERAAWDREPEPGLYRITFDAERSLGIRRAAERGGTLAGHRRLHRRDLGHRGGSGA